MRLPFLQIAMEMLEQLAPEVAVELDHDEDAILGKLVRLVRWGLGRCPEHLPPSHSAVVIGPNAAKHIARAALWLGDPEPFVNAICNSQFSILEKIPTGIRFKGLDRYDPAWEVQQSKSNRARKAAEARWPKDAPAMLQPCLGDARGDAPAMLQPCLGDARGDAPAMLQHAHTQTHIQTQIQTKEEEKPPPLPQKPTDPFESGPSLWASVQHDRHAAGYVTEKPPHPRALGNWFSEFMGELNGDTDRATATIKAFFKSTYWKEKNFPFQALMKGWREFTPRREVA